MKRSEKHFKPELNAKLLNLIEEHKVLYDISLPEYAVKEYSDQAWEAISQEIDLPVAECRSRWRNLRVSYRRYLRQMKLATDDKRVRPFYLVNEFKFLDKFIKKSPNDSTLSDIKFEYYESHSSEEAEEIIEANSCINNLEAIAKKVRPFIILKPTDKIRIKTDHDDYSKIICYEPVEEIEEVCEEREMEEMDESGEKKAKIEEIEPNSNIIINVNEIDHSYSYDDNIEYETIEEIPAEITSTENNLTNTDYSQVIDEYSDPDLAFLRSLLPDIKQLNAKQKSKFKLSILTVLNDILYT